MANNDGIPPVFIGEPEEWFHGSPLRLETLATGSTVTPAIELAKAFSHKPSRVGWTVEENDSGDRRVSIEHNGTRHGYLYKVLVTDPSADLVQHPTSVMSPGDEMLVTRDVPLEFIGEVPVG